MLLGEIVKTVHELHQKVVIGEKPKPDETKELMLNLLDALTHARETQRKGWEEEEEALRAARKEILKDAPAEVAMGVVGPPPEQPPPAESPPVG